MRQPEVAGHERYCLHVSRQSGHNRPENTVYLVCRPKLSVYIRKRTNQHDTLHVEMDNSEKLDAKMVRLRAAIVNSTEYFGILALTQEANAKYIKSPNVKLGISDLATAMR